MNLKLDVSPAHCSRPSEPLINFLAQINTQRITDVRTLVKKNVSRERLVLFFKKKTTSQEILEKT